MLQFLKLALLLKSIGLVVPAVEAKIGSACYSSNTNGSLHVPTFPIVGQ